MTDNVLGVHLFVVVDTDAAVDEVKIPDVNLYISSISDGDKMNLQYGPVITKEEKQQLSKYFSNGVCFIIKCLSTDLQFSSR